MHAISYADWSGAEYRAALRCILTGRVARGGKPALLAQRLAALYAPASVYPVNFGHTAIRMALALFVERAGGGRNEVVIPRYICPSVVQSVQGAGLVPVMADVGADLNLTAASVQAVLGPRTLAVIAPHMFGCPADIGAIERVCRAAKVFLIDDAAQVVGVTRDGRQLGTFGDVGVVSFAQSKTVVAGVRGAGGLLLVNNAELDAPLRARWQALAPARGRLHALVYFLFNYLWRRRVGHVGYYFTRMAGMLGFHPRQYDENAKISNLDAALALAQLGRLEALKKSRIAVVEAYQRALDGVAAVTLPQYAPGRYLARVMVALPPHVDIAALRARLTTLGVETRTGYPAPAGGGEDDAWMGRLLGLPFRAGMEREEVDQVCRLLRQALESTSQIGKSANEAY